MQPFDVDILVLNFNGRQLLAECLGSVICAARQARYACRVTVVDNDSTDGSREFLAQWFPEIRVVHCANRGLCSLNEAVAQCNSRVAVLLNNDVKLTGGCLDPLVEPLRAEPCPDMPRLFLTAPLCRKFDGATYDGQKTAIRWRWGLVQATSLFAGHEQAIELPDLTASAGAAIAVDRQLFVELGGFDPLYLPGRLEDLDLCYRAYQAGYSALYVPSSVVLHLGQATFRSELGAAASHELALRNTLLFQWKNLRHPAHVLRQLTGLPSRVATDAFRAPWQQREHRWMFTRALVRAVRCWSNASIQHTSSGSLRREREFFERFAPRKLAEVPVTRA